MLFEISFKISFPFTLAARANLVWNSKHHTYGHEDFFFRFPCDILLYVFVLSWSCPSIGPILKATTHVQEHDPPPSGEKLTNLDQTMVKGVSRFWPRGFVSKPLKLQRLVHRKVSRVLVHPLIEGLSLNGIPPKKKSALLLIDIVWPLLMIWSVSRKCQGEFFSLPNLWF